MRRGETGDMNGIRFGIGVERTGLKQQIDQEGTSLTMLHCTGSDYE